MSVFSFLFVSLAFILPLQGASVPKAVATFGNSATDDVKGTISVSEGEVTVHLDFTNGIKNRKDIFNSECFSGGLQYHVHDMYENLAYPSAIGAEDCGSANLGGHFDPFAACGPATGNTLCSGLGGCIKRDYNCINDFKDDPFACEIGDWSGKYGYLKSKNNDNIYREKASSFFEISAVDLIDRGVVIHCNDGRRIACAKWKVKKYDEYIETKPDQKTHLTAEIDFSSALKSEKDSNKISLLPNGYYNVEFDFSDRNYLDILDICGKYPLKYFIFEEWNSNKESLFGDSKCKYATGGASYDPEALCLPFSQNKACYNYRTCDIKEYNCKPNIFSGYSCSPSDLSGRYGYFDLGRRLKSYETSGIDYFMPSIENIVGRSVAVTCGYQIAFCAQIKSTW